MKRAIYVCPIVLGLAIVILPSLIGQNTQGPHFPVVVASRTIQAGAPISRTILFVPVVTGMYRVSSLVSGFDPSVPCTFQIHYTWTDETNERSQDTEAGCGFAQDYILSAKAGTPLSFSVNFADIPPQLYTFHIVAERL
jgi:hypothetical protein